MSAEATAGLPGARSDRSWHPAPWVVAGSVLLLVWVTVDVIVTGPWYRADIAIADWVDTVDLRGKTVPNAILWLLAQTGGRGAILMVVGALTLYVMRERRVWQPALRVAAALALLTVVVYALKLGLGRTAPGVGASILYADGLSYPSGHSANAVLWWGVAVWLVRSYGMQPWLVRTCTVLAVAAPAVTTVAMLLLNYHWLTDVVAGLALGVVLLRVLQLLFSTRLGDWGNGAGQARTGGRGRSRELMARPGASG